jgi:hypothetical protein
VYGFGGRNKLESEKFTCKIDLDCRFFLETIKRYNKSNFGHHLLEDGMWLK